jgi:hypothetical protein
MHKYARMIYNILFGYRQGINASTFYLTGWTTDKNADQNHRTEFQMSCQYVPDGPFDPNNYRKIWCFKVEIPAIVEVKHLYRALYELKKDHGIHHNITDEMLLKALNRDTSPTVWDMLVKDTDDNGLFVL